MHSVCSILDEQTGSTHYSEALQQQQAAIEDPDLTPSAMILHDMHENKECFFEFANRISTHHEKQLCNSALSAKDVEFFENHVRQSIEKQRQIEASDTLTFDEFLQNYFSNSVSGQEVMV